MENQLLYAVVQVDKKEGDLRLQCRWLDDLTRADETMILACDIAFDQAKTQVRKFSLRSSPKKEISKKLFLQIDATKVRLSHILEIKKIFRIYSGTIPVTIEFWEEKGCIGTLLVESNWGISFHRELEEELRAISSITLTELKNSS